MQHMNPNPTTYFEDPPTPEQLQEVEHRKPIVREALRARLRQWEQTGLIGSPDLEPLEWPAEEPSPLTATS
ncbi:MAG: hypothetical protein VX641_07110 [Planctomycetota bacterium]|nr:hypothetical protein [Planctomycetota bacterium]